MKEENRETLLILELIKLTGKLTIKGLKKEDREKILIEIRNNINDYLRGY